MGSTFLENLLLEKLKKMNKVITVGFVLLMALTTYAQKYKLQDGKVDFYSYAPLEDIVAKNSTPVGIIDAENNTFSFRIKIKDFIFESALMQEHFNENYMESDKYPTGTFKGNIVGNYDLKKEGVYNVKAKGELTIHGVTKNVEIPSKIEVTKKGIQILSDFKVKLVDHNIEIPTLVFQKIAEVVDVKVRGSLIPM